MYSNQNYNYYPQQQPLNQYMRQPQMAAILKGRMVSSIEEANIVQDLWKQANKGILFGFG